MVFMRWETVVLLLQRWEEHPISKSEFREGLTRRLPNLPEDPRGLVHIRKADKHASIVIRKAELGAFMSILWLTGRRPRAVLSREVSDVRLAGDYLFIRWGPDDETEHPAATSEPACIDAIVAWWSSRQPTPESPVAESTKLFPGYSHCYWSPWGKESHLVGCRHPYTMYVACRGIYNGWTPKGLMASARLYIWREGGLPLLNKMAGLKTKTAQHLNRFAYEEWKAQQRILHPPIQWVQIGVPSS
jgi:hypothetical protein